MLSVPAPTTDPDSSNNSGPSPAPSFQIDTVPSPVQNLQAVLGNGNVILTWQKPANDSGHPVDQYRVTINGGSQILIDPATAPQVLCPNGTSANCFRVNVGNLTNDTQYTLAVAAHNAVGYSDASQLLATPSAGSGVADRFQLDRDGVLDLHDGQLDAANMRPVPDSERRRRRVRCGRRGHRSASVPAGFCQGALRPEHRRPDHRLAGRLQRSHPPAGRGDHVGFEHDPGQLADQSDLLHELDGDQLLPEQPAGLLRDVVHPPELPVGGVDRAERSGQQRSHALLR